MLAAGVDGCKGGWIAVWRDADGNFRREVFAGFAGIMDFMPADAVIAVDMPIGLPDFIQKGGRGPERLVRPLIGERQSSVFSIPSRAAVYADTQPFTTLEAWYGAHRHASAVAMETSDPPRGVSIQAFGIFSKIRELDALLCARPDLRKRVIESHPEVAFWKLNDDCAMSLPKKIRGRVNPAGMDERRALLSRNGFDPGFIMPPPPRGAAADDFLDACAMLAVAERFVQGKTMSFPDPPFVDSKGNPIAIRV